MFTIKNLAGDLVSLPVTTEDEFKKEYIKQYVKPEYQPFVTLHIEDGTLLVNLHPILPTLESYLDCDEAWAELSGNPAAVSFLKDNLDKISWRELSYNSGAISLIEENLEKIYWSFLSCNEKADDLFRRYPEKVHWQSVAELHPNADRLIKELAPLAYRDYLLHLCLNDNVRPEWVQDHLSILGDLHWSALSRQKNMVPLLELYPGKIVRESLFLNPSALELIKNLEEPVQDFEILELMKNTSRSVIDWVSTLPEYENKKGQGLRSPGAVIFLETLQSPGKYEGYICINPLAVHLVEKFADQIQDMSCLESNGSAAYLVPKYIDKIISREREIPFEIFRLPTIICPDPSKF